MYHCRHRGARGGFLVPAASHRAPRTCPPTTCREMVDALSVEGRGDMGRRLVCFALASACAVVWAAAASADADRNFQLRVLSSPPEMVTGGDALVQVTIPRNVPPAKARVLLNG